MITEHKMTDTNTTPPYFYYSSILFFFLLQLPGFFFSFSALIPSRTTLRSLTCNNIPLPLLYHSLLCNTLSNNHSSETFRRRHSSDLACGGSESCRCRRRFPHLADVDVRLLTSQCVAQICFLLADLNGGWWSGRRRCVVGGWVVLGGGGGCLLTEREVEEEPIKKCPSFLHVISITPLSFDGNYKIIPGVVFVLVFLCQLSFLF
ncbi:hypothetical protein MtrunA17_Chr1g0147861 [Medicago truncatula]|uniref:Transmembrane protein n=1 Tax=Medicago truncatula TaxID=3880 RepID=A0A396JKI5_MEDTR|nr:hypothetical protein MtrunA17_Chr1g0147861 [Medicago truncatula]